MSTVTELGQNKNCWPQLSTAQPRLELSGATETCCQTMLSVQNMDFLEDLWRHCHFELFGFFTTAKLSSQSAWSKTTSLRLIRSVFGLDHLKCSVGPHFCPVKTVFDHNSKIPQLYSIFTLNSDKQSEPTASDPLAMMIWTVNYDDQLAAMNPLIASSFPPAQVHRPRTCDLRPSGIPSKLGMDTRSHHWVLNL